MTIGMIEASVTDDLITPDTIIAGLPEQLRSLVKQAFRSFQEDVYVLFLSEDVSEEIRKLVDPARRFATGCNQIWRNFPELRSYFTVIVSRITPAGSDTRECSLGDVVAGDIISSTELSFYGFPWHSSGQYQEKETISLGDVDFSEFDFLKIPRNSHRKISLIDTKIYFVSRFSIAYSDESYISPDIIFLNYRDFFENTDFLEIANKRNEHLPPGFSFRNPTQDIMPILCSEMSGAIIFHDVDEGLNPISSYNDIIVNRIFAAAALSRPISGQILGNQRFQNGRFASYSFGIDRDYGRPYLPPGRSIQCISANDPIFSSVIHVINSSNIDKFYSGKEDYRLKAIDTIDDSRRPSLPVLQFAQIWMAMERLLSFRQEVSSQISLSLCSLFPSVERAERYKEFKKLYNLRSEIVHGYSFQTTNTFFKEVRYLASIFRKIAAFGFRNKLKEEKSLKQLLMDHVLSGNEDPIC